LLLSFLELLFYHPFSSGGGYGYAASYDDLFSFSYTSAATTTITKAQTHIIDAISGLPIQHVTQHKQNNIETSNVNITMNNISLFVSTFEYFRFKSFTPASAE